jgi:hypothetical protein
MRSLLLILAGSAVLFMGLAILQEWSVFQPFFAGRTAPAAPPECPPEAVNALERFNTVLPHLYLFGGDPRFYDRLPASERVKLAIAEDLEYLARTGIVQVMDEREIRVLEQRPLPGGACEVRTEETWALHYESPQGERFSDDKAWAVLWRYVLRQSVGGWEVAVSEPVHEP